MGIKLCFEKSDKKIKPLSPFTTIITNANGERMYMMNYHLYRKFDVMEFQTKYRDANPLRYFFNKVMPIVEENLNSQKEKTKNNTSAFSRLFSNKYSGNKQYLKQKNACAKFSENDYIFVPYCFTLISSSPNGKALQTSIESIIKTLGNALNSKENFSQASSLQLLEELLVHLIFELPASPLNTHLYFNLPFTANKIEIQSTLMQKLPTTSFEASSIFTLSIENIIIVHYLTLMEQKILFLSSNSDYNSLTQISEVFVSLLYPLRWVNTYIPVLSEDLVKYLQSFMPFIMGLDENLLKIANEYMETEAIYIVDLKKDAIFCSKDKKKLDVKNFWKNLPNLPEENLQYLTRELKTIKHYWEKVKKDKKTPQTLLNKIDMDIRDTFAKSMMILFGDYKNFTSFIDNVPFFNSNSFIANRKSSTKNFYNDLTQTQIFRHFLQLAATNSEVIFYQYYEEVCNKHRQLFIHYNPNNNPSVEQTLSHIKRKDYTKIKSKLIRSDSSKLVNSNRLDTNRNFDLGSRAHTEGSEKDIIDEEEGEKYYIASFMKDSIGTDWTKYVSSEKEMGAGKDSLSSIRKSLTQNSKSSPLFKNKTNIDLEKKIFDENFNLDILNVILINPPSKIRKYNKIEEIHKKNSENSSNLPFDLNLIKTQEDEEENVESSWDNDHSGEKKSNKDKINSYWKLIKQTAAIREQRKMFLSMIENDEKMNKLKQQGKNYF
jgi:hypothetical protein